MSTPRHAILTQASPSLEFTLSDASAKSWELVVYGGTFGGAVVKVARKLADTDADGNTLAYVHMQTPDLQDPLSISAAAAGYKFDNFSGCGKFKVYLSGAGGATSVTVGVAFCGG